MKKGIAISLIIMFVLMLATPVFAVNTNLDPTYSNTVDITAVTSGSNKYSVDVEWGDMTFKYDVGEWNTENHNYVTEASEAWDSNTKNATTDEIAAAIEAETDYTLGSGQILVRNHSNQPVRTTYTVDSSKPDGFKNVVANVKIDGVEGEKAATATSEVKACSELGTTGNANVPYQTAEVTLEGVPTYRANLKVGSLTIAIEKVVTE